MSLKDLCISLAKADKEEEVISILKKEGKNIQRKMGLYLL